MVSLSLPEAAKRFLQRKRKFGVIAHTFAVYPERRQTLIYEALGLCRRSICVATPFISADILSVLDYASARSVVRVLIGDSQPDEIWNIVRLRSRTGFEVRVCSGLHLKLSIFDSLFLVNGSANLTSISIANPGEEFTVIVDEGESEFALERFFALWNEHGPSILNSNAATP